VFNDILRKVEMRWYEIRKKKKLCLYLLLMLTILQKSRKEYLVNIKKKSWFYMKYTPV